MFRASAPGSLMLLGEYAALQDQHALVCAIDKRVSITLSPREDARIIVNSALGQHETTLDDLQHTPPFQFVLAALNFFKKKLKKGCMLTIESEFSATVGFASSAAVTVATLAVLSQWLELSFSPAELIQLARAVILEVQGVGSGADAAACVLGGIVLYRKQPFVATQFPVVCPITVVYSGSKTPTPVAIKQVTQAFAFLPELYSQLLTAINECTLEGADALSKRDWRALGKIMNIQQGLMDALGVNTKTINNIIQILRQQPSILGAKISGSGLGDCVVGLGECSLEQHMWMESGAQQIAVNISEEGVRCEKI